MKIEVVYALPDLQHTLELELAPGATVADALVAAELDPVFCRFPLSEASVGVWNRVVERTQPLHDLDRVEIYRPLVADPKDARRVRATRQAQGRE